MTYDLNFWPEVDWRKESSLDPRFLVAIAVGVLLAAIAASWCVLYSSKAQKKGELAMLKMANEQVAKKAENIVRKKDCVSYWRELEASALSRGSMRMPVSRQLAAIASVIPNTVTLSSISFRSQLASHDFNLLRPAPRRPGDATPKRKGSPKMEPFLCYECVINGIAHGGGAEAAISNLSRKLSENKEIVPWVDRVELTRLDAAEEKRTAGAVVEDGKSFTLVMKYKPVDWYDESSIPKVK